MHVRTSQDVLSALPAHPPKLLDQVRNIIRTMHYSYKTEQAYIDWIRRYIYFHDKRHPQDMGAEEIQGVRYLHLFVSVVTNLISIIKSFSNSYILSHPLMLNPRDVIYKILLCLCITFRSG